MVLPESEGDGKLKAEQYCAEILDKELFDFWMESMEDVGNVLVMEDGAPYHQGCASKRRKELMDVGWEGWGPGTWPSNSPDLNPLENLWHIVRSRVKKRRPSPLTKAALGRALQEEWERLDVQEVNNLCDSMPQRLQAVIAAEGGTTGY